MSAGAAAQCHGIGKNLHPTACRRRPWQCQLRLGPGQAPTHQKQITRRNCWGMHHHEHAYEYNECRRIGTGWSGMQSCALSKHSMPGAASASIQRSPQASSETTYIQEKKFDKEEQCKWRACSSSRKSASVGCNFKDTAVLTNVETRRINGLAGSFDFACRRLNSRASSSSPSASIASPSPRSPARMDRGCTSKSVIPYVQAKPAEQGPSLLSCWLRPCQAESCWVSPGYRQYAASGADACKVQQGAVCMTDQVAMITSTLPPTAGICDLSHLFQHTECCSQEAFIATEA